MSVCYSVVKKLSEGLVCVESDEHGRQIWHLAPLRKARRCEDCEVDIPKGSEAWAPITHQLNRMHRIHKECLK